MNKNQFNEEIAKMLRWRKGHKDFPTEQRWKKDWFDDNGNRQERLLFGYDWNQLMLAVEFIENIKEGIYQVDILQEGCKIQKNCNFVLIDCTVSKFFSEVTKLESTFNAVARFAILYNNNSLV